MWTLSAGNRTLLRAQTESDLLHNMCRVIVERGGYRHACVAYAGHDEQKSIHWKACVGLEEDVYQVLMATQLSWADTKDGQSAVSVAIRTGQPSVTPLAAIPADVSYALLREAVLGKGFVTVGAFPLLVGDEILGALALSCDAPDAFDEEEIKLLSELAEDIAYGVAHLRMREKHDEAQATIARLAYYDPLTNLPNRTLLLERLDAAMQAAKLSHRSLALLHLDVGRFHEVNKVLGYHSGDLLLQEVARRLLPAIKENETLARVGETGFSLLLPTGSADYAIQTAQRLAAILRDPVAVSSLMLDANVSIGIALFPGHATAPDALLRRAHAALRQNRPTRDGYAMYTGGQEEEYTRRLSLMGDLHGAIAQNELLLYCQPKVDIASRRVRGVEALVRWQHPAHGMVLTAEFIKLAEQAGLITPLTNWMMEAAFSQAYAWREAGLEQALSVNLSALDLRDPRLIDRIRGLFSTWGIAPELIQFELTESALMEDPAGALETLGELKGLGTRLFIDDFGTGYSSLSYLQKLPVDSIKIDQSFVAPMIVNNDSAVIVRSTIELGHNLDLEVVAEGVESQAIWDQLAVLGCDVAQGYLVSAPMPAERFKDWESEWSATSPQLPDAPAT
ncbi:MAG TPA: GGDEF domain-containing protein [Macromonas sp.]|nr:GGDEF domain-containing protein [Macromonas sp.]